ncbi:ATP-binding protein [Streptomyces fulvorobeus]|uniref:ATP-binding protein n=1 Tax=Streptomyces fulvorobeus TaxID=284028 RepID=UPI0015C8A45F
MPSGPTAPRIARDFVGSVLCSTGCPPLADDARLCVSELVTNAHCHTRSRLVPVEVIMRLRQVTVYVSDDGTGSPPRPEEPPRGQPSENGRGLLLVSGPAIRWGVAARGGGRDMRTRSGSPSVARLLEARWTIRPGRAAPTP